MPDSPAATSTVNVTELPRGLFLDAWSGYADIGITALMPSGLLCRVHRVFPAWR